MTGSIGWWTWILWSFGRPFVVTAPACTSCSWLLHLRRLLSLVLTVVLLLFAFFYLWPLVEDQFGRAGRRWVIMLLGLACILPQLLFELFYPHPFDITAFQDTVDYEFSDAEMAYEFAELNEEAYPEVN